MPDCACWVETDRKSPPPSPRGAEFPSKRSWNKWEALAITIHRVETRERKTRGKTSWNKASTGDDNVV